jgi:hypothetical protein
MLGIVVYLRDELYPAIPESFQLDKVTIPEKRKVRWGMAGAERWQTTLGKARPIINEHKKYSEKQ